MAEWASWVSPPGLDEARGRVGLPVGERAALPGRGCAQVARPGSLGPGDREGHALAAGLGAETERRPHEARIGRTGDGEKERRRRTRETPWMQEGEAGDRWNEV